MKPFKTSLNVNVSLYVPNQSIKSGLQEKNLKEEIGVNNTNSQNEERVLRVAAGRLFDLAEPKRG